MDIRDETLKMYEDEAVEIIKGKGAPKPEQMMKLVAALPFIIEYARYWNKTASDWLWKLEHYRDWYVELCEKHGIEPQEVPPKERR